MENSTVAIRDLNHVQYKCTYSMYHKYTVYDSLNNPKDLKVALFYFDQHNIPYTYSFHNLSEFQFYLHESIIFCPDFISKERLTNIL